MKVHLTVVMIFLLSLSMNLPAKGKCENGYKVISCKEFKQKKRDFFCWANEKVSKAKQKSICLKSKKRSVTKTKKK